MKPARLLPPKIFESIFSSGVNITTKQWEDFLVRGTKAGAIISATLEAHPIEHLYLCVVLNG